MNFFIGKWWTSHSTSILLGKVFVKLSFGGSMSRKLNLNSKMKEIYENPMGHDILNKLLLQLNKKEAWLTNPLVRNLPLKVFALLINKFLGKDFMESLLNLLNLEQEAPIRIETEVKRAWWKEAVFYQIYPRSFQDYDGDGIGDLKGIISRLDYLKELGVNAIWLSPIYDSPNDDNGYDIRDYYGIMKEFGTMEDFDELLGEVHKRDMRLIMDLVINHTSDEHPWFRKAIEDPASKYHDYYMFKQGDKDAPPNNWTSFFSGSAWNYYEENKEWALHLFSTKQMDLNWNCKELREEIKAMIRWWLEKGVDGFRMDVVNYISKAEGLPMGNENIGKLLGYYGIEHYFFGPKLHEYLRELKKEAFAPFDAFTVGETPGVGREMGKLLTGEERKELDMIFSFDHLETPGHVRFDDYRYDLNYLKEYMCDWMDHCGNNCWMSLFFENHDNPRMISKVDTNPIYREVLGKLLALIQLTLKGTPFVFQGQEIGSINKNFASISEMRDVESINLYNELVPSIGEVAALNKVLCGSRDHARTPMQWDEGLNGGFSKKEPWIKTDDDYEKWNIRKQLEEKNSILNFYKELIQIRSEHSALIYGDFEVINRKKKNLFTYFRKYGNEIYYVECNLSNKPMKRAHSVMEYALVLSNYPEANEVLLPYEANLYRV